MIPYTHDLVAAVDALGRRGRYRAVIVHAGIAGAWRNDKSQDFDGIGAEKFAGFRRVFSGHYHYRHAVDGFEHIQYIGSPMQHTFAEMDQDKGVLLWDDKSNVVDFVEILGTPKHCEAEYEWHDARKLFVLSGADACVGNHARVKVMGPSELVKGVTRDDLVALIPALTLQVSRDIKDETVSRLSLTPGDAADLQTLAEKYVRFREPPLDVPRLMEIGKEMFSATL